METYRHKLRTDIDLSGLLGLLGLCGSRVAPAGCTPACIVRPRVQPACTRAYEGDLTDLTDPTTPYYSRTWNGRSLIRDLPETYPNSQEPRRFAAET